MKLSHNIGVFSSIPTSDRFVYHNGLAPWSMNGTASLTDEKVIAFAKLARDGGIQFWNNTRMPPAKYCVFDVETAVLETIKPDNLTYFIQLFKKYAPDVKVGVYGYAFLSEGMWSNRDSAPAQLIKVLLPRMPVYDLCDFINDDVYLMGKEWLKRDFQYIRNMSTAYGDVFPNKPWIPWVHGRFTSDDGNPTINRTTCLQYAKVLRESCDGVLVWHRDVPDIPLHNVLSDRRRTQTDRGLTWASEIWDQSVNWTESSELSSTEVSIRTPDGG